MSDLNFPQVVRGLLVAIAILFAIIQIALLGAGPADRTMDSVLPLLSGAR